MKKVAHSSCNSVSQTIFLGRLRVFNRSAVSILPILSHRILKCIFTGWDLTRLIIFTALSRTLLSETGFLFMSSFDEECNNYQFSVQFNVTLRCKQYYQPLFLHHQCKEQHTEKANSITVLLWKQFWLCAWKILGHPCRSADHTLRTSVFEAGLGPG